MEIIRLVGDSALSVKHTLGVPPAHSTRWYVRYAEAGYDGLASHPPPHVRRFWNRISESERPRVVEVVLGKPELTPRELA